MLIGTALPLFVAIYWCSPALIRCRLWCSPALPPLVLDSITDVRIKQIKYVDDFSQIDPNLETVPYTRWGLVRDGSQE